METSALLFYFISFLICAYILQLQKKEFFSSEILLFFFWCIIMKNLVCEFFFGRHGVIVVDSINRQLPAPNVGGLLLFGEGGPVRFVTNQILCNKPLTFLLLLFEIAGQREPGIFVKIESVCVCVIRKRLLLCSPTDSLVFLFFVLFFFPSCSKPRDDEMNSCAPDVHVSMWLGHATGDAGGDHLLLVDFGRFFFLLILQRGSWGWSSSLFKFRPRGCVCVLRHTD